MMIDHITSIKHLIYSIQKHGIIECHRHYETNTITIKHDIIFDNETLYVLETDFKYELTLIMKERYNDTYFRLMLYLFKSTDKILPVGLSENFRGDYFEEMLETSTIEEIIGLMNSFMANSKITTQNHKKLETNLSLSISKILTTEMVFKEDIAQFSHYSNGGAYIGVNHPTNNNILERLQKYPVHMDWIDMKELSAYGFESADDLLNYLINTDFYKQTENELLNNFNYVPELFIDPVSHYFKFTCKSNS
ncbi:MAG: hypothetical protein HY062_16305 [Bacteroidetes bacterium]|nr:hypothetical protein [Bacteroidota bacterium]